MGFPICFLLRFWECLRVGDVETLAAHGRMTKILVQSITMTTLQVLRDECDDLTDETVVLAAFFNTTNLTFTTASGKPSIVYAFLPPHNAGSTRLIVPHQSLPGIHFRTTQRGQYEFCSAASMPRVLTRATGTLEGYPSRRFQHHQPYLHHSAW